MNEYVDTKVIECNRLHSEEALSNNNENPALWTNNLTDVIHLDAGDKVSVHGAMISERGAGQSSSIEIKGQSLGFTQTFTGITNISGINASSEIPSQFEELEVNLSNPEIEVRDDTAYFKIGYYINMNGHNYIQLPRRWWWNESKSVENFTRGDDRVNFGMSLADPFTEDCYTLFEDYYQLSGNPGNGESGVGVNGSLSKVKNDNSKFTIMVRRNTYYSEESASGNFPEQYLRDPENIEYYPYQELKEIKVEKGFNSPEYIAEDITRQLQQVTTEKTFEKRNASDLLHNASRPGFPAVISKSFDTETYKTFNCAGIYAIDDFEITLTDRPELNYGYYINGSNSDASDNQNGSGYKYLKNYHIVGCKRPELYTTGRLLNRNEESVYQGIKGTDLYEPYTGNYLESFKTIGMITNVKYNEERVNEWRDFIRAQELYPEVFNIFSDSRTPYDDGDSIDNCRWWHMNRLQNASMYLNASGSPFGEGDQLGWGGYIRPTWWDSADKAVGSVIVPFQYDESQRDIFYDKPDEKLQQKSYGCFGRSSNGHIVVYPTEVNGCGSTLFDMLFDGSENGDRIEQFRKCGYDLHFSAQGNAWCLPTSGFNEFPIGDIVDTITQVSYDISRNNGYPRDNYQVKSTPLHTQLYLGADAPRLNWDGTNFSISDLHTAMNRGNSFLSDSPFRSLKQHSQTEGFDDVVYKINPAENYEDWTPARQPYIDLTTITISQDNSCNASYDSNTLNENLEPWVIYDSLCGITLEDFGLTEKQWKGTLWDLLGFSYKQFHSSKNTRLGRIDYSNANDLSVITTNAEINEGDTKIYSQNLFGVPMMKNMLPLMAMLKGGDELLNKVSYVPQIIQKTESIKIIADNLPTRMIRGYYTIRSNILEQVPFIGGKKNNTTMPIISVVDKINGDGDFYFQQESSLEFTITKPLRLASITCSIHDPDGSYANVSEQSTILYKVHKDVRQTFNVAEEILQEEQGKKK